MMEVPEGRQGQAGHASGRPSYHRGADWRRAPHAPSSPQRARDPFPLPVPPAVNRAGQRLPLSRRRDRLFGQRLRFAESVRSVNALCSCIAAMARHHEWPSQTPRSVEAATTAQQSILSSMERRVAAYGSPPTDLSGEQAFSALLKSDDMYFLNTKNVADYDSSLLKVAKSNVMPKIASTLLPEDPARFLLNPDKYIVRSDEEMHQWRSENSTFRPYWDAILSKDRSARVQLYRMLAAKGLIVLRPRIKSRVGIFVVEK